MKQAILITAYKDLKQVEKLILHFNESFEIYIHIDKKSRISMHELNSLKHHKLVKFISRKFKINWGGVNHLKAIILLAEQAYKNGNEYFHLITGQDIPIKNVSEFETFFKAHRDQNFLEFNKLPYASWAGNGGLDRINLYNFYDLFDAKKKNQMKIISLIQKIQQHLQINRDTSEFIPGELFGGGTYWSLSREAIQIILREQIAIKRFNYTFCAEEIFFQTILLNSEIRNKIINNDLRFIIWSEKHGNIPAILDEEDFKSIITSENFFARKIQYGISNKLISLLNLHIH